MRHRQLTDEEEHDYKGVGLRVELDAAEEVLSSLRCRENQLMYEVKVVQQNLVRVRAEIDRAEIERRVLVIEYDDWQREDTRRQAAKEST